MCLHDMLCGSLGVIKFDVEFVVSYFLQNILPILILKRFARDLRLSLIGILAYDMQKLAYFKEVSTVLSPKKHFPCSFSIVFA